MTVSGRSARLICPCCGATGNRTKVRANDRWHRNDFSEEVWIVSPERDGAIVEHVSGPDAGARFGISYENLARGWSKT